MSAKGKKFRITYQIPGLHRLPREAVVIFLGMHQHDQNKAIFSGRPEFGTTELDKRHIISYERVADTTKCYADKKVRP